MEGLLKMNNPSNLWNDVDLSNIILDIGANQAIISLTSNFDGAEVAKIICAGILHVKINSAIDIIKNELPVFVAKVTITKHVGNEANLALNSADYGFRFENGSIMPPDYNQICTVEIEGGEIDIRVIARNYCVET